MDQCLQSSRQLSTSVYSEGLQVSNGGCSRDGKILYSDKSLYISNIDRVLYDVSVLFVTKKRIPG